MCGGASSLHLLRTLIESCCDEYMNTFKAMFFTLIFPSYALKVCFKRFCPPVLSLLVVVPAV